MTVKDNSEVLAQQAKSAGVQGDPPTIESVTLKEPPRQPPKVPNGTPCPVIPRICIPDACVVHVGGRGRGFATQHVALRRQNRRNRTKIGKFYWANLWKISRLRFCLLWRLNNGDLLMTKERGFV